MKLRRIFKPWNAWTGRQRRPLVLPKEGIKIPGAEVTLEVALIEEFRVLRKLMIDDDWAFIIVDNEIDYRTGYPGVRIIKFDEDGNAVDISTPPVIVHDIGPSGVPKRFYAENNEQDTNLV